MDLSDWRRKLSRELLYEGVALTATCKEGRLERLADSTMRLWMAQRSEEAAML